MSRLHPKKGLDLLLPAYAKACKVLSKPSKLIIAGSGNQNYERELRKLASDLKIANHVKFIGFIEGEQKRKWLNKADIFALTSYSENFGMAVIEALAAKVPVLITEQVGICNYVRKANAGLVVNCEVKPITDALIKLIKNASLRRQMGINGCELVSESFSAEAVGDKLLKMYKEVAAYSVNAKANL